MRPELNEGMNETFNERYISYVDEISLAFIFVFACAAGKWSME